MKDKKPLLFIGLAAVIALAFLFLSRPYEKNGLRAKNSARLEAGTAKLEAQVKSLQDLLRGFVHLNKAMKNTFLKEKKQREDLEGLLKNVVSQNETLARDLAMAKVSLELTEGLRQRLREAENSLAKPKSHAGKEDETKKLFSELNKNLSSIDAKMPDILKENTSYKQKAQELSIALEKRDKELRSLKDAESDRQALKNNLNNLKSEISRLEKELKNKEGRINEVIREKETAIEKAKQQEEALAALKQGNKNLEKELSGLKKEKQALAGEIEAARSAERDTQGLKDELKRLQEASEQIAKEHDILKTEYKSASERLIQNTAELGKRADNILALTERLNEKDLIAGGLQAKSRELEKESASLREENVALQLEKEELSGQMEQLRLRLSDMETRADQIGNLLKISLPYQGAATEAKTKSVEVEVYPAKAAETTNENSAMQVNQ